MIQREEEESILENAWGGGSGQENKKYEGA